MNINSRLVRTIALLLFFAGLPLLVCGAETYSIKTIDLTTGIRMVYAEAGDVAGEAVLLLHGYTDTKRSFFATIVELTRLRPDLHIFAPDLRGHGASSMPDETNCAATPEQCFQLSDFAADVLAFMDAKTIEKVYIAGHSMGSLIAQEIALIAPERISRMILIATGATSRPDNAALHQFLIPTIEGRWKEVLIKKGYRYPADVYRMTLAEADPEPRKWLAENWVTEPLADPAFLEAVIPETMSTPLGTWIGCVRSLSKLNNVERLKELKVPTLVIWAIQDNVFSDQDQALLRDALAIASKQRHTALLETVR